MVRRQVIAREKRYKCPICPRQAYTLRGVAQHLAMSWEETRVSWRTEHGLSRSYETMVEVKQLTQKIEEILKKSER